MCNLGRIGYFINSVCPNLNLVFCFLKLIEMTQSDDSDRRRKPSDTNRKNNLA